MDHHGTQFIALNISLKQQCSEIAFPINSTFSPCVLGILQRFVLCDPQRVFTFLFFSRQLMEYFFQSSRYIRDEFIFFLVPSLLLCAHQPGWEGSFYRERHHGTCRLVFNYLECLSRQAYRVQQQDSNSISLRPPEIQLRVHLESGLCVCMCSLFIFLHAAPHAHSDDVGVHMRICVSRWQECQVRDSGRRVIVGFTVSLQVCVARIFCVVYCKYVGVSA